jgi:NAD(P)-dependent dehydrogenase (short-subunit alcohol dehydrogenase family)
MTLDGRVVLVTGGARRLGRAIALALARRRARVAVSYRTSAREARQTLEALERLGAEALAVRADLARAGEVRRLIERVGRRFGRLDVLINSAAAFDRTPFGALSERDWDRALDANLKGPFLCALYASRLMRARGGGKIINLADWAGVRPYRDYLPYCVSKAGVIGLTKALAKELAPAIQVNAVAPGPILPPAGMSRAARERIARRVPLGRWGSPQDIVNTVLFLLEGTDFMTGSVVFVDGGQLIA